MVIVLGFRIVITNGMDKLSEVKNEIWILKVILTETELFNKAKDWNILWMKNNYNSTMLGYIRQKEREREIYYFLHCFRNTELVVLLYVWHLTGNSLVFFV